MLRSFRSISVVVGTIVPAVVAMRWIAPHAAVNATSAIADDPCELRPILSGRAIKYSAKDSLGKDAGYAILAFKSYQFFVNSAAANACPNSVVQSIKLYALRGIQSTDAVLGSSTTCVVNQPGRAASFGLRLPLAEEPVEGHCTVVVEYAYTLVAHPAATDWKYVRRLGVFDLANASDPPQSPTGVKKKSGSRIMITPVAPLPPPVRLPTDPPAQPGLVTIQSVMAHGCNASFSVSQHLALYNVSFELNTSGTTSISVTDVEIKTAANNVSDPNSSAWTGLPLNVSPASPWEQNGIQGRYDGSSEYSLLISVQYTADGVPTSDWLIGHFENISAHLATWIDMS
jgi:hypothetical protein